MRAAPSSSGRLHRPQYLASEAFNSLQRGHLLSFSRLSSTSGISLRPGLGVFLRRPVLRDPEAEGWRILIDVNPLDDDQQNHLEDAVREAKLRWRRINRGGLILLEIHAPRAQHSGN
jgi:hypothetical protein